MNRETNSFLTVRCLAGIAAAALLLSQVGCAGARSGLRFDQLEHPVSMSGFLLDERGRKLSPNDLDVVGDFEFETRRWGLLYSWVPLGDDLDVSAIMGAEIERVGGEAMINVTVESRGCTTNYLPAVSLLPIWPGCADVTLSGQIVKRQDSKRVAQKRQRRR